jgi:uncharacterized OsmC-like protein
MSSPGKAAREASEGSAAGSARVEKIRRAFERNARAMELRASVGQGTAVTRVRLADGLRCEVSEGPWKLTVDMGEKSGGTGAGPNPGVLGRAALGSCMAVCYAMWAARLGFPLAALEVEVQADYDSRGYHGVAGAEPGYVEVRYVVHISSSAPEDEVVRFLDEADRYSDYLAVFAHPQKVRREVRYTPAGA